jgi:hypothetical protein
MPHTTVLPDATRALVVKLIAAARERTFAVPGTATRCTHAVDHATRRSRCVNAMQTCLLVRRRDTNKIVFHVHQCGIHARMERRDWANNPFTFDVQENPVHWCTKKAATFTFGKPKSPAP